MKKIQKIWLGVFCTMFLIPEMLWNPVAGTFAFLFRLTPELYQLRSNFLLSSGHEFLFGIVFIIQFIGILGTFIILIKKSVEFEFKTLAVFTILVILLATAISTLIYIGLYFSAGTFSMMG
jgi:hypothetical protein